MADGEFVLYRGDDGRGRVQLRLDGDTVWLSQAELADLYGTSVPNIVQIVSRVLADGEVDEATINSELRVRAEGSRSVRREIKVYNLEMILAVGFRVSTPRAVHFRQWATTVLTEYLVKGFALDDARLKGTAVDYFDELLERIRAIRASEKRFYQKVQSIFAASVDYDGASPVARTFFATIQNKLLHAVTGRTAAELLKDRCDPHGLTLGMASWSGAKPRKSDAKIAKNYLTAAELSDLDLLTTQFLDFAESRARRRLTTTMADWVAQTDRFLEFNEHDVLVGSGNVSTGTAAAVVDAAYATWLAAARDTERDEAARAELVDLDRLVAEQRRLEGRDSGER